MSCLNNIAYNTLSDVCNNQIKAKVKYDFVDFYSDSYNITHFPVTFDKSTGAIITKLFKTSQIELYLTKNEFCLFSRYYNYEFIYDLLKENVFYKNKSKLKKRLFDFIVKHSDYSYSIINYVRRYNPINLLQLNNYEIKNHFFYFDSNKVRFLNIEPLNSSITSNDFVKIIGEFV